MTILWKTDSGLVEQLNDFLEDEEIQPAKTRTKRNIVNKCNYDNSYHHMGMEICLDGFGYQVNNKSRFISCTNIFLHQKHRKTYSNPDIDD